MKGRKPKPTAFRVIEGNREHRTIHLELEPKPRIAKPPRPKNLNAAAKKHWNYIIKHLSAMNTLGESDQGTIMAAAMAYGQIADLQADIVDLTSKGFMFDSDEKLLSSNRRLLNNTMSTLVRFEAELGLNPTARTRIKLDKPMIQTRRERLLG